MADTDMTTQTTTAATPGDATTATTAATATTTATTTDGTADAKTADPVVYGGFKVGDKEYGDKWEHFARVKAVAERLKLTPEQYQEFTTDFVKGLDDGQKAANAAQTAEIAQRTELYKTWGDELQKDAEFGGEKFKDTQQHAANAVNKLGSPKLAEALKESGLGNYPDMIRLLARVGKMMAEGEFHGKGGGTQSTASRMWPGLPD